MNKDCRSIPTQAASFNSYASIYISKSFDKINGRTLICNFAGLTERVLFMIEKRLTEELRLVLNRKYGQEIPENLVQIQKTRKDVEGDYTLVVFPLLKLAGKSPELAAAEIGETMLKESSMISSYQVIRGFLNLFIREVVWLKFFTENYDNTSYGFTVPGDVPPVVIEYSSPNTNKPLHLGHIRNNLLGLSLSRILYAAGLPVVKVNLVNDRGIHICKSMLAWQKWGGGETPESSGMKGDHLVGKYYVIFDQYYRKQVEELVTSGMDKEEATRKASLILEAQEMLRSWENHDEAVIGLWKMMNGWVYEGFEETYRNLGISFDKTYYESQTYLLGKKLVSEGLMQDTLMRKEDGSVWIDLTDEGLDEKLLLRSDGTSVYMTQDLGTAQQRYEEFKPQQLIYVVGNEQEYHFQVLKKVLKHLGRPWAEIIYHLSYGMVELPEGKMKSREGTVVDADDLMQTMFETAEKLTRELGKVDEFSEAEAGELFRVIGLGALKYFILKVDPRKNMLFNPAESIDFNGNTGPFVQYTHARIRSVLRNAEEQGLKLLSETTGHLNEIHLFPQERELLRCLHDFPSAVDEAATTHSPAVIANYVYELAVTYNRFYHDLSILKEPDPNQRSFRLQICIFSGNVIRNSMWLLGIDVPERM